MKRSLHPLLTSLVLAAMAVWAVTDYGRRASWVLPLTATSAFLAAWLAGALVDFALLRQATIFYEDLARSLLLYAFLGLVTTMAIEVFGRTLGVRIDPGGPALVLHAWMLILRPGMR